MNEKTCRHFNGICGPGMRKDHVQCTVGNKPGDYVEHDGRMNTWPCINGNSTAKKCPKFDPFTAEECAKDKAEWDAHIKVVIDARKRIPTSGASGVVECPKCKGKLQWRRAVGYNNHVHARCDTPDCLSWME